MKTTLTAVAAIAVLLGGTSAAQAQKASEQFVPLGQSPGLSATHTDIAEIEAVTAARRAITLKGAPGGLAVTITDRTSIWLDRTKYGQTNLVGDFSDLREGRQVEVKYEDNDRQLPAEWIKMVPPEPD